VYVSVHTLAYAHTHTHTHDVCVFVCVCVCIGVASCVCVCVCVIMCIGGLGGKSVVVSSNLRRCIETAIIGLWGRFGRPSTPPSAQQQLVIMSDLQEASANVDTYSLSKPMRAPPLTQLAKIMDVPADRVTKMLEVTGNGGQKKMFESGLV
jgi:hypothetical protein